MTELEYWSTRHYALLDALREWPKFPQPHVLKYLGEISRYPEDSAHGKAIQRELGSACVPFVSECECGAGFWDRITQGAWRTVAAPDGRPPLSGWKTKPVESDIVKLEIKSS